MSYSPALGRFLQRSTVVIAMGITAWACRVPGVEEDTFMAALALWVTVIVLWGVRLNREFAGHPKRPTPWHRLLPWSLVAGALVTVTIVWSGYPERAAFWYSSETLRQAAEACRALPLGNDTRARWIGCYRVLQLDRSDTGVLIYLANAGPPSEPLKGTGWAYCPGGPPTSSAANEYRHFDGAWYIWTRVAE